MYTSGQASSESMSGQRGCAETGSGFSSSQYASGYSPGDESSGSIFTGTAGKTLLSVVSGAALGGVLMYLLDPEEGRDRRRYVGELAGGAWETVRDTAAGLGAATAGGAGALASGAATGSRRLGENIAGSRLGQRIGRGTRQLREETSDRMRYLMQGDQRTARIQTCTGEAMAALACLALGAGSMYLLDPRDGARRRHVLRDKFLSGFGRMATSLERLGRDTWNRTTGMVHELKARRSHEYVDDRTLVERIRANAGHCVSANLNHVQVSSINGRVTLAGSIPAQEVDNLLKCAWSTPGVKEIINQLNTGGQRTDFATERSMPTSAPMGSTINCPNPS